MWPYSHLGKIYQIYKITIQLVDRIPSKNMEWIHSKSNPKIVPNQKTVIRIPQNQRTFHFSQILSSCEKFQDLDETQSGLHIFRK